MGHLMRMNRIALSALVLGMGCSSSSGPSSTASTAPTLLPGEACDPSTAPNVVVHFDPPSLVLAPGQARPVKVIVDPDLCLPLTSTFATKDSGLVSAPTSFTFDLRHPTYEFQVQAAPTGPAKITATSLTVTVPPRAPDSTTGFAGDRAPSTGTMPIEIRPPTVPTCTPSTGPNGPDSASGNLSASSSVVNGAGNLADAYVSVAAGAFQRTDEFGLSPFSATVSCAGSVASAAPGKLVALGPAVTFTPQDPSWLTHALRREVDFAVPVNPAAMPAASRMRHVVVLYQGPRAKTPRAVPVANPRFHEASDHTWVMTFSAPWFGTYQAAVPGSAGTVGFTRHLTHRAVLGISMGGGGAGIFGWRHHDQFDAIAPLGGNSDLTWPVWDIEQFKFGGFCPASQPNCPKYAPNLYPLDEPFAHTEDFDHWFYQPGGGTGGTFSRADWTQMLEDFSLMGGNPNGQNADPSIPFMVVGPKASDPFVHGTVPNTDCSVTIEPISPSPDDPPALQAQEAATQKQQQQTQQACLASRCDPANAWKVASGFYDGQYNPDGSHPVIGFCDGGQSGMSPYVDTWSALAPGQGVPSNLTLAVDLNGNGVRDPGEPVIRQGEEPYQDTGTDGKADADESGYDPLANPDPNQDDYDFALNPNGTENDHTWEQGEPYQDVGLDGVPGTPQQSAGGYDVGEGDGKFTLSAGAAAILAMDPHAELHGRATPAGGPITPHALTRVNLWADGGVRDMANFAVVSNHLVGAVGSVLQPDGTQVKSTAFYNNFENLPGADPTQPDQFLASQVLWSDVAQAANLRYGALDATPEMIQLGDGQHVGTATQIVDRLVTGFYFAANSWPDVDRTLPASLVSDPSDPSYNAETTTINELGTACEIKGHCETYFTGPVSQRKGPLAVTLPPGYALEASCARDERYPVLYVLHGYGQDPRDLEATAAITANYEADRLKSSASRLAKMIVVYVDGRCRIDPTTNAPECVRGTFFLNSQRQVQGHPIGRLDDWFEEVIQYVDKNYRTMAPSDVDVVE